jgi:hypothetical protein
MRWAPRREWEGAPSKDSEPLRGVKPGISDSVSTVSKPVPASTLSGVERGDCELRKNMLEISELSVSG